MDYLYHKINQSGSCGIFNLCQLSSQKIIESFPLFYKEIFQAWSRARVLLSSHIEHKGQVLRQPLFRNPCVAFQGRLLQSLFFPPPMADLHTLRDVLNTTGSVDSEFVLQTLVRKRISLKKPTVVNIC